MFESLELANRFPSFSSSISNMATTATDNKAEDELVDYEEGEETESKQAVGAAAAKKAM